MTNYTLIQNAIDLTLKYYEAEGIFEPTSIIERQTFSWYHHTDIADARILSAAVLAFGDFNQAITYPQIIDAYHFFYSCDEEREAASRASGFDISIYEIEEAQRDAIYW
jgi:hypothetical protein